MNYGRGETFGGMKWASKLRDTSENHALGKSHLLGMTKNFDSLDPKVHLVDEKAVEPEG